MAAPCLAPIQTRGNKRPLFFVHPVGGTVFCYVELSRLLGPDQPFFAFQSRGLEAGEQPEGSVPAMAFHYIALMKSVQPEGPYYLGGWSLGGVVAFEMARPLTADGLQVGLVATIDSSVPRKLGSARLQPSRLLASFAAQLAVTDSDFKAPTNLQPEEMETAAFEVVRQAQKTGALPEDLNADLAQRMFRTFRANMEALDAYAPGLYPGSLVCFDAEESVSRHNPAARWREFARSGIRKHVIPGDHFSIVKKGSVEILAEQLSHEILRADQQLNNQTSAVAR